MKQLTCWLVVVIALGCSAEDPTTTLPSPAVPAMAPESSVGENTPGADQETIVIDVRSQDEWDAGHVERAVLIPHTEIAERISEVTQDKDAKIVLYCAVGGRAGKAKVALEKLGFTNVENGGGYDDVKDRFQP